jgi:putative spermidine/putrescine transport system permease protein
MAPRADGVAGPALLVVPLVAAHVVLFAAPLLMLAATSFASDETLRAASLRAWTDLLGDPFNLRALFNTMKLGALTVLATSCLAIPLALVHLVAGPRLRRAILIAAILPLLTSVVVRSFAWIAILGREGVLSRAIQAAGLSDGPVQLLQTEPGLVLALTQIEMPLVLLPLLSALERLDPALLDASAVLGASLWRTLRCVVLPAILPGLIAGSSLAFASSSTAFISQSVIGGGRLVYLPALGWQQPRLTFDWPMAAALALLLMGSVLAIVTLLGAAGRRVHA